MKTGFQSWLAQAHFPANHWLDLLFKQMRIGEALFPALSSLEKEGKSPTLPVSGSRPLGSNPAMWTGIQDPYPPGRKTSERVQPSHPNYLDQIMPHLKSLLINVMKEALGWSHLCTMIKVAHASARAAKKNGNRFTMDTVLQYAVTEGCVSIQICVTFHTISISLQMIYGCTCTKGI